MTYTHISIINTPTMYITRFRQIYLDTLSMYKVKSYLLIKSRKSGNIVMMQVYP